MTGANAASMLIARPISSPSPWFSGCRQLCIRPPPRVLLFYLFGHPKPASFSFFAVPTIKIRQRASTPLEVLVQTVDIYSRREYRSKCLVGCSPTLRPTPGEITS
jgi:hypothetical protein